MTIKRVISPGHRLLAAAMVSAAVAAGAELVPAEPDGLPFRSSINTLTAADQARIEQAWERRKRRAAKRARKATDLNDTSRRMGDES